MTRNPAVWVLEQSEGMSQQRIDLRSSLRAGGFELRTITDLGTLLRRLTRERPELLLFECQHADDTIFSCCSHLRETGDDVPIVVVANSYQPDHFIRAFDAGADDCITQSSDPRELAARLRAVIRRRRIQPSGTPITDIGIVGFGECRLEFATRCLYRAQQLQPLTSGEYALLAALIRNPHRPLSRERLVELARGPGVVSTGRSVDVQVSRLRKLIEQDPTRPRFIQTIWGHGYVFVPDTQEGAPAAASA